MYANVFLFAILLFSRTVSSQYQCYYGFNLTMNVEYIPCGPHNSTGASTCCYLGDTCLAQGACFSPSTGMTYVAGSAQVEGLALCDDNWICCSGDGQQGDKPAKAAADSCPCDSNYGTIASGSGALAQTAFLPSTFGGDIRVIQTSDSAGLVLSSEPIPTSGDASLPPTAKPYITSTTTTNTPTSSSSITSSTSTPSSAPSASSGNSLTLPLAIGLSLGLTLLLAIILVLIRYYRRRARNRAAATMPPNQPFYDPSHPATTVYSPSLATSHMRQESMSPKQNYQGWQSPPPQWEPLELSTEHEQPSELSTPDVAHRRNQWR
ncbi:hypothetical protein MMC10_005533 [Thelotrema lepadinum]|nr:hypothetical protein [Thelotrema lepadinum]